MRNLLKEKIERELTRLHSALLKSGREKLHLLFLPQTDFYQIICDKVLAFQRMHRIDFHNIIHEESGKSLITHVQIEQRLICMKIEKKKLKL